jgi:hypothetical protein
MMDVHIGGYKKIKGSWVESIIKFYVNSKLFQEEYYNNIKVNPELDSNLFDVNNFPTRTKYWD